MKATAVAAQGFSHGGGVGCCVADSQPAVDNRCQGPSLRIGFPIVNGGGLILTTVVAALFFKEKLTAKSVAGLVLGVIAIIAINGL